MTYYTNISRYRLPAALLIAFLLFQPTTIRAENPSPIGKSGRLANGSAYRTDASGHRITDYLAELEITVQDLRNQVATLEDEIKKRDELLASFGPASLPTSGPSSKPSAGPLPDPLLVKKGLEKTSPDSWAVAQQPEDWKNAPRVPSPTECSHLVVPLNQRINRLEQVLASQKQESPKQQGVIVPECNRLAIEKPLVDRIVNLEQERLLLISQVSNLSIKNNQLSDPEREEQETMALKAEISSAHSEISRLLNENSLAKEQLASLQSIVNDAKNLALRQTQPSSNEMASASAATSRAKLDPVDSVTTSEALSEQPVELAPEDLHDRQHAITQQLEKVQSLVIQRKNALDRQKQAAPGVTISISPLFTRSGHSLDDLRIQTSSKLSATQLQEISREIAEISKILDSDIAILKGLSRM